MPDGAKTFLVIMLIPFLLGLGHDIYFNYFADDEKIREVKALRIDPKAFLVSDAGWVWSEYAPSSLETVRDSFEPSTWRGYVDPVLRLPTMVVGLIPFAISFVYLILSWVLGIWPCSGRQISFGGLGRRRKNNDYAVYKHAKAKSVKYKKK